MLQGGGGENYPPPTRQYAKCCSSYRVDSKMIFVRKFVRRAFASRVWHLQNLYIQDGRRKPGVVMLVTGSDINVMSAATTQFSVLPDPFPPVTTSSAFWQRH